MRHPVHFLAVAGILLMAVCPVHADVCAWRPWAADWSKLNPNTSPGNPTNWDYTFGQTTLLNDAKDTPSGGGAVALHMFFDSQSPDTTSNSWGSGGVYQQIAVTPGVPIEYSFYWKGKGANASNWFEFLLIDGPFSIVAADQSASANIKRKVSGLTNSTFA